MAKTATEGFTQFISRITPSDAERAATSTHRAAILAKLNANYTLYQMFESGSFSHGTGVSGHSDVDYFVSLNQTRSTYSSTILTSFRTTLLDRFPSTSIHVSRPAVVLEFGAGYERVEVIPAYADEKANGENMRFRIPAINGEWMWSTPEAHSAYVSSINNRSGIYRGAKSLARMVKSWKYERNVPISSFYLEMRAAEYMDAQTSISWPYDISFFFNRLVSHQLAAMNDPTGSTGRIEPCSSDANKADALSKLQTAASRADKALELFKADRVSEAFAQWDLIWNGKFPAFY